MLHLIFRICSVAKDALALFHASLPTIPAGMLLSSLTKMLKRPMRTFVKTLRPSRYDFFKYKANSLYYIFMFFYGRCFVSYSHHIILNSNTQQCA